MVKEGPHDDAEMKIKVFKDQLHATLFAKLFEERFSKNEFVHSKYVTVGQLQHWERPPMPKRRNERRTVIPQTRRSIAREG